MSAIRMLSAKLFEPTTTVSPLAGVSANGSEPLPEDEEQPTSRDDAVTATVAMTASRRCLGLDQLLFTGEVTISASGLGGFGWYTGVYETCLWRARGMYGRVRGMWRAVASHAGRTERADRSCGSCYLAIQSSPFEPSQEQPDHRSASMSGCGSNG